MPKVVPEYREQARQRIISGAMKVFAEKGYDGATIGSIAKALGVSQGAIYLYFKNKRELFKAILECGGSRLENIAGMAHEAKHPINSFLNSLIDAVGGSKDLSDLFLEFYSEAARDPQLKKIMRKGFDKDRETVENFLKEVKKKGEIGLSADLRALSLGLIGLTYGCLLLLNLGIGKDEAKRAYVDSTKAMLKGTM